MYMCIIIHILTQGDTMNIYINDTNESNLRDWHAQNDDRSMSGLINILLKAYFSAYGTEQHNLQEQDEYTKITEALKLKS